MCGRSKLGACVVCMALPLYFTACTPRLSLPEVTTLLCRWTGRAGSGSLTSWLTSATGEPACSLGLPLDDGGCPAAYHLIPCMLCCAVL